MSIDMGNISDKRFHCDIGGFVEYQYQNLQWFRVTGEILPGILNKRRPNCRLILFIPAYFLVHFFNLHSKNILFSYNNNSSQAYVRRFQSQ